MVMAAVLAVFLFFLATMIALMEIEAEGKYGWAEQMPTWYRTEGPAAWLYGKLMSGKPMTGYHIFLNAFILGMLHLRFFMGTPWSLAAELATMGVWFAWVPVWDFLWFVLNPHYGVDKFRKENVWWHAKSYWVANRFPVDYLVGWVAATVLTLFSCWAAGSARGQAELGIIMAVLLLLLAMTISVAGLYHQHYRKMRRFDDRRNADIRHRL